MYINYVHIHIKKKFYKKRAFLLVNAHCNYVYVCVIMYTVFVSIYIIMTVLSFQSDISQSERELIESLKAKVDYLEGKLEQVKCIYT